MALPVKAIFVVPVIIAVLIGWLVQIDLTPGVCNVDDLLRLNPGGQQVVDPCTVFSDSYDDARQRFRELANKHGTVHSLAVYEDLTMDIAVLQGSEKGVVVHTSGVHGVEGYAGSAVQLAFLETFESRKNRPTVILVHAVNPYGMSRFRRWNENNVDLNRNALTDEEWTSYAGSDHYNKEAYAAFNELFNPDYAPSKLDAFLVFWLRAIRAIWKHGIPSLKAAMVGGQYSTAKGIFYGGAQREKSLTMLEEWLDEYMDSVDMSGQAVTWIDVHTGLGRAGEDTILAELAAGALDSNEITEWFPDSHNPSSSKIGKEVNAGYEKVRGAVPTYFCRKFRNGFCFTQEIGTVHNVAVAHAVILENAAHHYLPEEESLSWAQQTTRRAFYLPRASWRAKVLIRGLAVLEQGMSRSVARS